MPDELFDSADVDPTSQSDPVELVELIENEDVLEPEQRVKLTKKERRAYICRRRLAGYSFAQIASELGTSTKNVRQIYLCEYKKSQALIVPEAHEHLHLQLERCEELLKALWPRATESESLDPRYAPRNVEMVLKIMERQAKLLGLDAPVKAELKVEYKDMTDDDLLVEAQRLKIDVTPFNETHALPGEDPAKLPQVFIDAAAFRAYAENPNNAQFPPGELTMKPVLPID